MTSSIVTIIKNEHEYIDEWISYHLNLNIDHIFIFEDDNSITHKDIINKYSSDKVTLHSVLELPINKKHINNWEENRQHIYFANGLLWIKQNYNYDWCFAIDCDEYITLSNNNDTLQSVLTKYFEYDAIVLNWQNYNANGLIHKPDYSKKGILKTYTNKCGSSINDPIWKNTKLIYNLKTFKKYLYLGTHKCSNLIKWCKTDYSQELNKFVYDNIYLRHYITKSWEEYVWKLKVRGMFHVHHRNYDEFFEMNPDMKPYKKELMKIKDQIIKEEL